MSPAKRAARAKSAAAANGSSPKKPRGASVKKAAAGEPVPNRQRSESNPHAAALQHIEAWFAQQGWEPFDFQRQTWAAYLSGGSGLIHAATGTGKTYAAWLGPVIHWLAEHPSFKPRLPEHPPTTATPASATNRRAAAPPLQVLWITPLRALATDISQALRRPLDDLALPWTLESRTGDTKQSTRSKQKQRLPTGLVTTPESLTLLLTWPDAEERFSQLQAVVVDEWHELLGSKRGVQTELALARLRHWRPTLRTWALSATIGNLDEALAVVLGKPESSQQGASDSQVISQPALDSSSRSPTLVDPKPSIIRGRLPKRLEIDSLLPEAIERFPWAGHLGTKLLPEVLSALDQADSALVFTNTRAQTEIWYQQLLAARPKWAGQIALHHGSLDRGVRDFVEDGLRAGKLKCVVCTSSLDLGVDFSPVDRVFQVGSPKGVARLMQRAGRSGHAPGQMSRVTCVPTHAFELLEVAAAREALQRQQIESRRPLEKPLDVLAQHAVSIALGSGFDRDQLLAEVRQTHAYRQLTDEEWDWVLDFITRGGNALWAYPEYHRVDTSGGFYAVTDNKIARQHRMGIGTITSDAALAVKYLKGGRLGTIEESFVTRLKPGDRFVFAGKTLALVRIRDMTVWVRKANSIQAAVPRWMGGRMPLSSELAAAVRRKLGEAREGLFLGREMECVRPVLELQAARSHIPAADELLIEQVKTREGWHLYFYPFAGRLVHEGLAALLAYRLAQQQPISLTWSINDYGFELLSPDRPPLTAALRQGLFRSDTLEADIRASLNSAEMAKRQFREIARIAGLVFTGYPGQKKTARQLQASSGLFYDVFAEYDPENLLLKQAEREVLEHQLEDHRLRATLEAMQAARPIVVDLGQPTPFGFPLLVDRLRERLSSEKLADRIARMTVTLEKG